MQCNAMQCNAMQCNAMQCNAYGDYNQIVRLKDGSACPGSWPHGTIYCCFVSLMLMKIGSNDILCTVRRVFKIIFPCGGLQNSLVAT
jgi:hypothetical protein